MYRTRHLLPHTYSAFGQGPTQAKDTFAEHLEILVNVWEGKNVSREGTPRKKLSTAWEPSKRLCISTTNFDVRHGRPTRRRTLRSNNLTGSAVRPAVAKL